MTLFKGGEWVFLLLVATDSADVEKEWKTWGDLEDRCTRTLKKTAPTARKMACRNGFSEENRQALIADDS